VICVVVVPAGGPPYPEDWTGVSVVAVTFEAVGAGPDGRLEEGVVAVMFADVTAEPVGRPGDAVVLFLGVGTGHVKPGKEVSEIDDGWEEIRVASVLGFEEVEGLPLVGGL
jgi:hypothetical protein